MLFLSNGFIKKLKEFEGLRLEAYKDAAGIWTIGYGHTHNVRKGDKISEYCADEYLRMDLEVAQKQVMDLKVCRTQGELDALVDFVFNLGIGKLESSTLLQLIRAGFPQEVIMKEFRKWCYATDPATGKKKRLPGLWSRRNWEAERFYDKTDRIEEVEEKLRLKESGTIVASVDDDDDFPEEYCEE